MEPSFGVPFSAAAGDAAADAAAAPATAPALPPLAVLDSPQGAPASVDGAMADAQASEGDGQKSPEKEPSHDGHPACEGLQRDCGDAGGEVQTDSDGEEREEGPSERCEDGPGADVECGEGEGEEGERGDGRDPGKACSASDVNGSGAGIGCSTADPALESDQCSVSQTGPGPQGNDELPETEEGLSNVVRKDKENAHNSQRKHRIISPAAAHDFGSSQVWASFPSKDGLMQALLRAPGASQVLPRFVELGDASQQYQTALATSGYAGAHNRHDLMSSHFSRAHALEQSPPQLKHW